MRFSTSPPDVTAVTVTKETDVTRALRGSREMVAKNVPRITMETIAVGRSNIMLHLK